MLMRSSWGPICTVSVLLPSFPAKDNFTKMMSHRFNSGKTDRDGLVSHAAWVLSGSKYGQASKLGRNNQRTTLFGLTVTNEVEVPGPLYLNAQIYFSIRPDPGEVDYPVWYCTYPLTNALPAFMLESSDFSTSVYPVGDLAFYKSSYPTVTTKYPIGARVSALTTVESTLYSAGVTDIEGTVLIASLGTEPPSNEMSKMALTGLATPDCVREGRITEKYAVSTPTDLSVAAFNVDGATYGLNVGGSFNTTHIGNGLLVTRESPNYVNFSRCPIELNMTVTVASTQAGNTVYRVGFVLQVYWLHVSSTGVLSSSTQFVIDSGYVTSTVTGQVSYNFTISRVLYPPKGLLTVFGCIAAQTDMRLATTDNPVAVQPNVNYNGSYSFLRSSASAIGTATWICIEKTASPVLVNTTMGLLVKPSVDEARDLIHNALPPMTSVEEDTISNVIDAFTGGCPSIVMNEREWKEMEFNLQRADRLRLMYMSSVMGGLRPPGLIPFSSEEMNEFLADRGQLVLAGGSGSIAPNRRYNAGFTDVLKNVGRTIFGGAKTAQDFVCSEGARGVVDTVNKFLSCDKTVYHAADGDVFLAGGARTDSSGDDEKGDEAALRYMIEEEQKRERRTKAREVKEATARRMFDNPFKVVNTTRRSPNGNGTYSLVCYAKDLPELERLEQAGMMDGATHVNLIPQGKRTPQHFAADKDISEDMVFTIKKSNPVSSVKSLRVQKNMTSSDVVRMLREMAEGPEKESLKKKYGYATDKFHAMDGDFDTEDIAAVVAEYGTDEEPVEENESDEPERGEEPVEEDEPEEAPIEVKSSLRLIKNTSEGLTLILNFMKNKEHEGPYALGIGPDFDMKWRTRVDCAKPQMLRYSCANFPAVNIESRVVEIFSVVVGLSRYAYAPAEYVPKTYQGVISSNVKLDGTIEAKGFTITFQISKVFKDVNIDHILTCAFNGKPRSYFPGDVIFVDACGSEMMSNGQIDGGSWHLALWCALQSFPAGPVITGKINPTTYLVESVKLVKQKIQAVAADNINGRVRRNIIYPYSDMKSRESAIAVRDVASSRAGVLVSKGLIPVSSLNDIRSYFSCIYHHYVSQFKQEETADQRHINELYAKIPMIKTLMDKVRDNPNKGKLFRDGAKLIISGKPSDGTVYEWDKYYSEDQKKGLSSWADAQKEITSFNEYKEAITAKNQLVSAQKVVNKKVPRFVDKTGKPMAVGVSKEIMNEKAKYTSKSFVTGYTVVKKMIADEEKPMYKATKTVVTLRNFEVAYFDKPEGSETTKKMKVTESEYADELYNFMNEAPVEEKKEKAPEKKAVSPPKTDPAKKKKK